MFVYNKSITHNDYEYLLTLSMNGVSSEPCVSGTVHTGGACLSIGLGMMRDVLDEVHLPPTRLETEWGSGLEPSDDGSSVAQPGRADMQRRWPTLRRAEVEKDCRRIDSIMVHFYELI